jgi:2-dehydro-3-deoxy-D-gluconate 5-dehydrogenase
MLDLASSRSRIKQGAIEFAQKAGGRLILDSFKLEGKVALVTGASAGLGRAIALALAEAGASVACHGNTRSPEATCEEIRKTGRAAHAVVGDLSNPETPRALVAQTLARFQALDILVNNAGTIRRAPVTAHPTHASL